MFMNIYSLKKSHAFHLVYKQTKRKQKAKRDQFSKEKIEEIQALLNKKGKHLYEHLGYYKKMNMPLE